MRLQETCNIYKKKEECVCNQFAEEQQRCKDNDRQRQRELEEVRAKIDAEPKPDHLLPAPRQEKKDEDSDNNEDLIAGTAAATLAELHQPGVCGSRRSVKALLLLLFLVRRLWQQIVAVRLSPSVEPAGVRLVIVRRWIKLPTLPYCPFTWEWPDNLT